MATINIEIREDLSWEQAEEAVLEICRKFGIDPKKVKIKRVVIIDDTGKEIPHLLERVE